MHPTNGGPDIEETVTVACIMDGPTITVYAQKNYKALIDLGATISLLDTQHTNTLTTVSRLQFNLQLQN